MSLSEFLWYIYTAQYEDLPCGHELTTYPCFSLLLPARREECFVFVCAQGGDQGALEKIAIDTGRN
jgi:hypothetical protein